MILWREPKQFKMMRRTDDSQVNEVVLHTPQLLPETPSNHPPVECGKDLVPQTSHGLFDCCYDANNDNMLDYSYGLKT